MYKQNKGHLTAMAGEFCVMERLFQLGHEAALTFGNAKSVDIMTMAKSGKKYEVSVKAIQKPGKWNIGKEDYSKSDDLVFVLLLYREKDFPNLKIPPEAWGIPAKDADKLKRKWLGSRYAIFDTPEERDKLSPYKDAWVFPLRLENRGEL
jgi:hypothetical protein